MRRIELTRSYKRDYKKVISNPLHRDVNSLLNSTMETIASDTPLEFRFRDHLLTGEYKGHRECHLKPDLLRIYGKPDEKTALFVRLGSHSELF